MGGGGGGWVAGWLDQVGIRLTQLSTGLKVEAELGNITPLPPITETQCQRYLGCYGLDFDQTLPVGYLDHL